MSGLDWIIVGLSLFCLLRGLMRGAVAQIFGIAGLLGGFLVAAHFYDPVSRQLLEAFPKLGGTQIISFIVLFFLTWFCISFVGFWMARVVRVTGLAFLDRISGGILGLGKALILAMILISVLTLFVSPQSPFLRQSYLAPYVQEAARIVIQATPQRVQNLFDQKRKELGRYWIDRNDETKKPSTPLRKREPSI